MAQAEAFAEHSLRTAGRVPPTLLADGSEGQVCFSPNEISDEQSKDDFTAIARLICIAHTAAAAVMILESWMTMAEPGKPVSMEQPPHSPHRKEIVLLAGETAEGMRQKILPIIRTDAGGFFGFGDFGHTPGESLKGRFAGILSAQRPEAKDRMMARLILARKGINPTIGAAPNPSRN